MITSPLKSRLVTHLHAVPTLIVCALALSVFGAEPAELLGDYDGLQCYHDGSSDVFCLNIKTGRTWKVLSRTAGVARGMGSISADGTKFVCNDGTGIVAVNLDGTNKKVVAQTGVIGYFFLDEDGNEWIGYNGEGKVSSGTSGTTWKVRIDGETNEPIESTRQKILDEQYTCGISNGGTYIGETYAGCLMKNLETGQSVNLVDKLIGKQCCWGQICPEDKPRILCTPSVVHDRIALYEWDEQNNKVTELWDHDAGFSRWSTTNDDFCVAHFDRHDGFSAKTMYLIQIGVDGKQTQSASLGIKGFVGGPWIGTLGGVGTKSRQSLQSVKREHFSLIRETTCTHGRGLARRNRELRGTLFRIDGKMLSKTPVSSVRSESGIYLSVPQKEVR